MKLVWVRVKQIPINRALGTITFLASSGIIHTVSKELEIIVYDQIRPPVYLLMDYMNNIRYKRLNSA
jgi:hypothetical protein